MITSIQYGYNNVGWLVTLADGRVVNVPDHPGNQDAVRVRAWIADGGVVSPAPVPETLTNEMLVDMAGPVLTAFIKAYATREGLSLVQVRSAIVEQL